jgi:hypothetical protein
MSAASPRLILLILFVSLAAVLSDTSVPSSALPLAPQLTYDNPAEGLSLLYPSTWEIAEEPTENGHLVAWYDPVAQAGPRAAAIRTRRAFYHWRPKSTRYPLTSDMGGGV